MPLLFAHTGDIHLDEDRYFADTAPCLEWFVADDIHAGVGVIVINGELTTYWTNPQHAAGPGHSVRNSVLGRNRRSPGCCQWQGVRAQAESGDGP